MVGSTEYFEYRLLRAQKHSLAIGIVVLFSWIDPLLVLLLIPSVFRYTSYWFQLLTTWFLLASIAGVILIARASLIKSYRILIDQLKKIEPNPLITDTYAVIRFEDVIAFTTPRTGRIYFAKLELLNAQVAHTINVPTIFRDCLKKTLADFKVYRCEGRYSVPTPDKHIYTVDSVIYVLPSIMKQFCLHPRDFSQEQLLRLVMAIQEDHIAEA